MNRFFIILSLFLIVVIFTCAPAPQPLSQSNINSEQLKLNKLNELQKSIVKITCSAYYNNYYYSYPQNYKKPEEQESLLTHENITTNSVAGSGLILFQDSRHQLILSCYHVLDFQDTLRSYYLDKDKQPTKFLSTLSIKTGQNLIVFHKNGRSGEGRVIAYDEKNDIVLIEAKTGEIMLSEYPFLGSFGDANKLRFGQETYLLGFPKGFFMVTRGLASHSPYKNKFMVDAPFNRGFSGGIVITFIDKEPYYQYVGMANSIAYNAEMVLAPEANYQTAEIFQNVPYEKELYVKELKLINYGITFVIKSNNIINFLKKEKDRLRQLGFDVSEYIK